jgi:outer membrane protein
MPLYQGGRTQAQIKEARIQQQQATNRIKQSEALLLQTIRQHWRTVQAIQQEVAALEQAVTSAQISKEGVITGFKVGSRSNLDVLNAEQLLATSQKNLQTTKHRYVLQWLLLRENSGTLSIEHLQTVNNWMK